jgi:hypothetical protein
VAIVHIDAPSVVDLDDSGVVSSADPDLPEISLSGADLEARPEGWVLFRGGILQEYSVLSGPFEPKRRATTN